MESISLFSAKYEAKKMHRRILENSMGWKDKLPKWTHRLGAVDRGEEEWRHQEDAADQQQQVAVALEVACVADDQQGEDVGRSRRWRPSRLALRMGGFQRAMMT
jgi:hypothetical protein